MKAFGMTLCLPRVDRGHTWINGGIYPVLYFVLESWNKQASRWYVRLCVSLYPQING